MRSNLLRAAAVLIALGAPIASASSAFAYAGDDYNYARDSWPQVQTWQHVPNEQNLARGPALTRTDATQGGALQSAPRGTSGVVRDATGIVHYGYGTYDETMTR